MQSIWKNDTYLKPLVSSLPEYDLLSFDVFDTILFRTCYAPDDVFEIVGQKLSAQCGSWHYPPTAYKELRKAAATKAYIKKPSGCDCSLEEILAEMPFSRDITDLMRQLEIESEHEALYLNTNIYSLMLDCVAQGKKIVIVSDMYYSKKQILSFLAKAGVNTDIISDLFVSSEYGCNKQEGLFNIMLSTYPHLQPERVLHIGDNLRVDVEAANKAGIPALHYNTVPHDFGSLYDFEKYLYQANLGELAALRKLAATTHPYAPDSESAVLHAIGAEIIGPAYALYAEWVVQFAVSHDIQVILPFMREGELLTSVITNVIQERKLDIICSPFFASRRSLFTASIIAGNYDIRISQIMLRKNRSMAVIFAELGLDLSISPWKDKADLALSSLTESDEISGFAGYLHSDKIKEKVLAHSTNQRKALLQYLKKLTGGRFALTVDYAAQGTCCRYLYDIGKIEQSLPPLMHTLMMATKEPNIEHILNGAEIFSWLGIAGENDGPISRIYHSAPVLEVLLCATCGTTLSYSEEDNEVSPVLETQEVTERQKRLTTACWEGVKTFQEYWLKLSAEKPNLHQRLLDRKESFLNIILRLIETPTKREAESVGAFEFSDNFLLDNSPQKVSSATISVDMGDSEIKAFITTEKKNGNIWPQAAVASSSPGFFNRLLINSFCDDNTYGYGKMVSVVDEIKAKQYKKGVIYGASDIGRRFQNLAALLDISIVCFVDSNKQLHGANVSGIEIKSLSEVPKDTDYFIVGSYAYSDDIKKTIQTHYSDQANQPEIFTL